jgi:hypothetical protein
VGTVEQILCHDRDAPAAFAHPTITASGFRVSARRQGVSNHAHSGFAPVPQETPPMPRTPEPSAAAVTNDARWAAVAARDARCDGAFVYAVATTGVYCRPSCPARPKRENMRFHAAWADAEAAGFRPCKRCKPRGEPLP